MPTQDLGINSWLEDELYQEFLSDHRSIDQSWQSLFATEPVQTTPEPAPPPPVAVAAAVQKNETKPIQTNESEQLVPLRGAAARIAETMDASLSVPPPPRCGSSR